MSLKGWLLMAETIYTPDGQSHVLLNIEMFPLIARKYMGEEAEKIVRSMIDKDRELYYKSLTDCDSYEATIDSNNMCFSELLDILDTAERELKKNHINRARLRQLIELAQRCIENRD